MYFVQGNVTKQEDKKEKTGGGKPAPDVWYTGKVQQILGDSTTRLLGVTGKTFGNIHE